jgi:hypothetical protein
MSTPIQTLLSNLLLTSKLGDTLPESSRKYLLEWAVYQRMGVVLRCLLEGPDITQYFWTGHKEKLVTWTAKNASEHMIETLWHDRLIPPRGTDRDATLPLDWAIRHGCDNLSKLMINLWKDGDRKGSAKASRWKYLHCSVLWNAVIRLL